MITDKNRHEFTSSFFSVHQFPWLFYFKRIILSVVVQNRIHLTSIINTFKSFFADRKSSVQMYLLMRHKWKILSNKCFRLPQKNIPENDVSVLFFSRPFFLLCFKKIEAEMFLSVCKNLIYWRNLSKCKNKKKFVT